MSHADAQGNCNPHPYTDKDLLRAAKEHVAAMTELHERIGAVAGTVGTLVGMLDSNSGAPIEGGVLYREAESALTLLAEGYEALRTVTDHTVREQG